ncbi:uncharacterized protein TRIVIDRAFT_197026 [Trichoderma virens Gv29-8]|uniref:Uncharacterized protein n=1 Tax=Hypocrea virens (strain Gv29-8 / FGSC 10586) TaxID=413071 RepID=G9MDJ6_HYPVG|nr:uncharacterized protein TRIVIDRAFT_197026 [Trichoderma virens Gv29-8]EHK27157.1 hypothetical protein TRIVIDRAFT_197026 [Trichoderma virens Gv29-8]
MSLRLSPKGEKGKLKWTKSSWLQSVRLQLHDASSAGWRQQTTARTAIQNPTEDRDRLRRTLWPDTERNDGVGKLGPLPESVAICCQQTRNTGSVSRASEGDGSVLDVGAELSLGGQKFISVPAVGCREQRSNVRDKSTTQRDGREQQDPANANGPRSRTSPGIAASNPHADSPMPNHAGDTLPASASLLIECGWQDLRARATDMPGEMPPLPQSSCHRCGAGERFCTGQAITPIPPPCYRQPANDQDVP